MQSEKSFSSPKKFDDASLFSRTYSRTTVLVVTFTHHPHPRPATTSSATFIAMAGGGLCLGIWKALTGNRPYYERRKGSYSLYDVTADGSRVYRNADVAALATGPYTGCDTVYDVFEYAISKNGSRPAMGEREIVQVSGEEREFEGSVSNHSGCQKMDKIVWCSRANKPAGSLVWHLARYPCLGVILRWRRRRPRRAKRVVRIDTTRERKRPRRWLGSPQFLSLKSSFLPSSRAIQG